MYTLDLSKLTEEQLKAFELIDPKAAGEEREKRSIYTEEDIRKGQIYTDLSKAYFFLKPMYDNMRNTDVKKTITESEILPVLEKVFRFCNVKGINYEKFAPVAEPEEIKLAEPVAEPVTVSETVSETVSPTVSPIETAGWMPQEVVEARETFPEVRVEPLMSKDPIIPMTVPEVRVEPTTLENTHPVETMSETELNNILANIPVVNKI